MVKTGLSTEIIGAGVPLVDFMSAENQLHEEEKDVEFPLSILSFTLIYIANLSSNVKIVLTCALRSYGEQLRKSFEGYLALEHDQFCSGLFVILLFSLLFSACDKFLFVENWALLCTGTEYPGTIFQHRLMVFKSPGA